MCASMKACSRAWRACTLGDGSKGMKWLLGMMAWMRTAAGFSVAEIGDDPGAEVRALEVAQDLVRRRFRCVEQAFLLLADHAFPIGEGGGVGVAHFGLHVGVDDARSERDDPGAVGALGFIERDDAREVVEAGLHRAV